MTFCITNPKLFRLWSRCRQWLVDMIPGAAVTVCNYSSPSVTFRHLQRPQKPENWSKRRDKQPAHPSCTSCCAPPPFFFLLSFDFLPSAAAAITTGKWLHHGAAAKNKFVPPAIYGHQYSRCSSEWLIGRDRSCTQSHAAHVLSPSTVQSLISGGRVGFSDRPRWKLIIQPVGKKNTAARREAEEKEGRSGRLDLHD